MLDLGLLVAVLGDVELGVGVGVAVLVGVRDGVLVGETVGVGIVGDGLGVGLFFFDGVVVGVDVLAGLADELEYKLAMNNRIASTRSRDSVTQRKELGLKNLFGILCSHFLCCFTTVDK